MEWIPLDGRMNIQMDGRGDCAIIASRQELPVEQRVESESPHGILAKEGKEGKNGRKRKPGVGTPFQMQNGNGWFRLQ